MAQRLTIEEKIMDTCDHKNLNLKVLPYANPENIMHDIDFPIAAFHLNGNGRHHNGESSAQRAVRARYQRLDIHDEAATDLMARDVHRILETLGENPEREEFMWLIHSGS